MYVQQGKLTQLTCPVTIINLFFFFLRRLPNNVNPPNAASIPPINPW